MLKNWLMVGTLALGVLVAHGHARAATSPVSMTNSLTFSPKVDTILVQDSVVWTNNASIAHHTATSDAVPNGAASFDTGDLSPGQKAGHKFTQIGTYHYHCQVHGLSMDGTIVVITSSPVQNSSWSRLKQLYRGRPSRLLAADGPRRGPRTN